MPIRHKDHFETDELENVTEEIVFEVLYHLIHEEDVNTPEDPTCLQDVAAIALNSLPPKYAVSYLDKVNPRPERLEDAGKPPQTSRTRTTACNRYRY